MIHYLVTEGYLTYSYVDEITLEEKVEKQPIHAYDVFADNFEMARFICEYVMGSGIYGKDFLIFEAVEDEDITAEDLYPPYTMN